MAGLRTRSVGVLAIVGAACGGEGEPCARVGELCTAETRVRAVAMAVDDAVMVDLDGDGEQEVVALSRYAQQVALGQRSGWRSVAFLEEGPWALAGLPGEVAVAVSEPPGVAIFAADRDGRLERRRDLKLDAAPHDLWSGDLDGDGRPELLVAHGSAGRLTMLDPGSGAARKLPVGGGTVAVAVGDLDGDAWSDIVAADPSGSSVHVLRGTGGGAFQPAREFLAGAGVESLALADHDGDGDVDVLARDVERPGVYVLQNNGAGELSIPQRLAFTEPQPTGIGLVAGPMSGDGPAGVTVPQEQRLATWLREGTRWLGRVEAYLFEPATWVGPTPGGLLVGGVSFVAHFEYVEAATPIEFWRDMSASGDYGDAALATGDLEGDGLLDVAAAGFGGLVVFRGTAEGLKKIAEIQLAATPRSMQIADVTGDGRGDIVLADDPVVQIVQTGGNGSFTLRPEHATAVPPKTLMPLRTGPNSGAAVAVVPVDYSSAFSEPVAGARLLRYALDGSVEETALVDDALRVGAVVGVDVDDDGADEPVVFGFRGETPVLTRMTPSGAGYVAGPEHELSAVYSGKPEDGVFARAVAGDPDQDGEPEVWMSGAAEMLRITDLAADPPTIVVGEGLLRAQSFRDVDRDGHLDAVSVEVYDDFSYQRGLGDGSFEEGFHHFDFSDGVEVALAAEAGAEFDFVSLSREAVSAHRLYNVARPERADDDFDFHGHATWLAAGDLNSDGFDDIVTVSGDWGGGVQVLWGDATASLARADGFNGGVEDLGLALGDLDGDGAPEVFSSKVSWLRAYRFWPQREEIFLNADLNSLSQVQAIAAADVDADGRVDLLALSYLRYEEIDELRLHVAYGTGEYWPQFTEWERALTLPKLKPLALSVGDVDGDGLLDALVRPVSEPGGTLVLADGPRAWAEPVTLPGHSAVFSRMDAEGRVELFIHDGDEIARLPDGSAERREVVARDESFVEGSLHRVVDVDGDGRGDLLVQTRKGTEVWLRGDGFRFAFVVPYVEMDSVDVADVDGDGRPDLVGISQGRVAVRLAAKP